MASCSTAWLDTTLTRWWLDGFDWNRSTPDGMGSIFSTIASALLGVLVGTRERHPRQRLLHLLDDSSWFAPANVTTTISI